MKAEGKLHAASNAEARTRTMKKSFEDDPFTDSDSEGNDIPAGIPPGDVEAGEESEVFPVPLAMAHNDKTYAMRAKFL